MTSKRPPFIVAIRHDKAVVYINPYLVVAMHIDGVGDDRVLSIWTTGNDGEFTFNAGSSPSPDEIIQLVWSYNQGLSESPEDHPSETVDPA